MSLSIFAAARDAPDATALVAEGRGIGFAALADEVRGALGELAEAGVAPGGSEAAVAFEATPAPATLQRLHALIALGVPALPLHPRSTEAERDALLGACPPRLRLGPPGAGGASSAPAPAPPPDDERPLAVIPTSGSSGSPRGVVLSRRAFVASARASEANLGWRDDDRWLLSLPVAHIGGLSVVTRCLLARRAVVLGPAPGISPAAVEALIETVARDRVTLLSLVPTQLQALLERRPAWRPPAHVRAVLLGGAPASPELRRRGREAGWPLLATYGLTEACSQVATQAPGRASEDDETAGLPLPGIEVRVVEGRLQLRGATLLSGYCGESATPLLEGGWFATQDRAHLDGAGRLRLLGRHDAAILTSGETVQPEEVERALEACPGVARACVFGVPDAERGEQVAAAIEMRAGVAYDPIALAAEAARRLAPFRRPRLWAALTPLPLTPSGKLDRTRTRERAIAHLEGD